LPPDLSAKNHPGARTVILNVCQIWRINHDPVEIDEDSAPECISDTKGWLNWNGDLDNPNDSEDDWVAYNEFDIEPENWIENPDCHEQRDMKAAPNVLRLIRLTRKSKKQPDMVFVTVDAVQMRRKKGVKRK